MALSQRHSQEDSGRGPEPYKRGTDAIRQAVEVSIRIGLIFLLVGACLLILRPFLALLVWGIIIAISVYPTYGRLRRALGGRGGLAAGVYTVAMLALLIVPVILLTGTVVQGIETLAGHLKQGTLTIPHRPPMSKLGPLSGLP